MKNAFRVIFLRWLRIQGQKLFLCSWKKSKSSTNSVFSANSSFEVDFLTFSTWNNDKMTYEERITGETFTLSDNEYTESDDCKKLKIAAENYLSIENTHERLDNEIKTQ